ncbi:MAG TPA: YitT family protein [Planococcus sp. (in: firmicutes)]|nr:YitT family protein [Planococcus sp. (in: firmicutes)]
MRRALVYRWLFFIIGLIVLALGFSMTIKGDRLGIGPWDVLHVGLYMRFGLTIGTWAVLSGFALLLITTVFTRRMPQVGTFLNMILIGMFMDVFIFLIPDIHSLVGQALIFLGGIVVAGFGVGIYVAPKIGAGPRDSLMLLLVEKTGWGVGRVKTGVEVGAALLGWLLGGPIGLGTVAFALLTGKFVQISLPMFENMLKAMILKKGELPPILKI